MAGVAANRSVMVRVCGRSRGGRRRAAGRLRSVRVQQRGEGVGGWRSVPRQRRWPRRGRRGRVRGAGPRGGPAAQRAARSARSAAPRAATIFCSVTMLAAPPAAVTRAAWAAAESVLKLLGGGGCSGRWRVWNLRSARADAMSSSSASGVASRVSRQVRACSIMRRRSL